MTGLFSRIGRLGGIVAGAVALAAGVAPAAVAPEVSRSERAEVRLLSEQDIAAPGTTLSLALHQRLSGLWHTYWENPGDSGLATTLRWTLPEGVEAGPIQWPTPERLAIPPLMNYGYSGEAVLITDVTLPADWPVGQPVEIRLEADWLVCETICVPEAQAYTLSLPTAETPVVDPAVAEVFARGRATQPAPAPDLPLRWSAGEEAVSVTVAAEEFAAGALEEVYFFPAAWGLVNHAADQPAEAGPQGLTLTAPKGDGWYMEAIEGPVAGVLVATDISGPEPVKIALTVTAEPGTAASATALGTAAGGGVAPVLAAVGLAVLGGLILNLMPCVFPVLALKALSFAGQGNASRAERRAGGLAYGAGVVVSFLAIAGLLVVLKAAGAAVGWGFQLQSPMVVGALAYVLFAVGLNLSGVFAVPSRFAGIGGRLADRDGHAGSFFTGVLAVVVASPCTAPFMGAALGYGLTQPWSVTLLVFAGLAVGFAAPIVALSMVPALGRQLPKPGAWMERLRQALAFPMYLAAVWLVWVFGKLTGVDAMLALLIGMVLVAIAAWALGSGLPTSPNGRRAATIAAVVALLGAGAALTPALAPPAETVQASTDGAEPYDAQRLATLRAEGRPVFLNFTADWCISCKVNERLVLKSSTFADALEAAGAAYMIGDWTRRDGEILAVLESFGRAGVPLYLVYPADGGEPEILPQILTWDSVTGALTAAAATHSVADASPLPTPSSTE